MKGKEQKPMAVHDKIKILLVDDNRNNLVALESILESRDILLYSVTSGSRALELILEHEFALVLLDVQMPDMDGFETAELMRGSERSKHIPIIFITAISKEQKYVFQGYKAGAVDYLFKPIEPEILKSKVDVFLDLYRQKRIIRQQSIDLAQKINELNNALNELQKKEILLKEKSNDLEKSNKELRDFAFIVSHDLKAPLRGINSLVAWIISDYRGKLDEQGEEYLSLLQSRANHMTNLIEGVLQYSRVDRIDDIRIETDLNILVSEIIDLLSPPSHIDVEIVGKLPSIVIERTRITQVFQNLISNAIKYMDKPHGKISISCTENGEFREFHVADNGPGIDKKYFDKIFQIFQTLTSADKLESTGIGLTIVKKIVEYYGGKVKVSSIVGKGSTFTFTLPKTINAFKPNKLPDALIATTVQNERW